MNPPNELMPPVRPEPSPILVLLLLAALSVLGVLLGSLLALGWSAAQGVDLQTALLELNEQSDRSLRDLVRMANLLNHIVTFSIPAILVAVLLYKRAWISYFKLDRLPKIGILLLGILFVIASFPFVQITYWLNHQFPLPEWMRQMEESTQAMVEGLLVMDSPVELLFNLLVIAVLPAIGEELVFRGILQQQLQRLLRNPAAGIWLAAILFSAIHMQFEGFLPRMILGATLGYVFYWTRSLWVSILAHFMTNAMQVVGQYVTDGKLTENDVTKLQTSDWVSGIISFIVMLALGYYLWKRNRENQVPEKSKDSIMPLP